MSTQKRTQKGIDPSGQLVAVALKIEKAHRDRLIKLAKQQKLTASGYARRVIIGHLEGINATNNENPE